MCVTVWVHVFVRGVFARGGMRTRAQASRLDSGGRMCVVWCGVCWGKGVGVFRQTVALLSSRFLFLQRSIKQLSSCFSGQSDLETRTVSLDNVMSLALLALEGGSTQWHTLKED